MKQASLAMPVKRALAIALSLVLACTTILVAPRGYAEETVDLHKYQKAEYAKITDKVFSLRKPSMFDGYKHYYTPVAEERDMYVSLGWEYVGEVESITSSYNPEDATSVFETWLKGVAWDKEADSIRWDTTEADGSNSTSKSWRNLYDSSTGSYIWVAPYTAYYERNDSTGETSYAVSPSPEADYMIEMGWENRGFRYGARDDAREAPVYRLYNPGENVPDSLRYYRTRDIAERDYLIENGWNDEGIDSYSGPETEEDLAVILDEIETSNSSNSNISVSGETGIKAEGDLQGPNIPENAAIKVTTRSVNSGAAFDDLDKTLGDNRIGDDYEINLLDNRKEVHNGFGEMTISLPIDAKYNGHVIIVHHHQGADGITKTRAIARDGYVSFTVTSLSGFAMEDTGIETRTMYRLYNPNSGEHFYTASAVERDATIAAGWNDEGIGWIAPSTSATPVYRLYSGTDHHYTMSTVERDDLVSKGWMLEGENAEGIAWYSDDAKTVPLYRQFNPNVDPSAPTGNSGSHNYTTSLDEHNSLVSIGWHDENIGWYAVAEK